MELQQLVKLETFNDEPVIKDYAAIKDIVLNYITEKSRKDLIITNKSDLRIIKDARTEIRKNKEDIKLLRQLVNNQYILTITNQFKELETLLDSADKELKARVDTFEKEQGKVDKPKIIHLTVKGYDMNKLSLVQQYAQSLGLQAEITKGE